MKLFKTLLPAVALSTVFIASGKADVVSVMPAGSFTNLVGPFSNGPATPFFNSSSDDNFDGQVCNIGAILVGQTDPTTCRNFAGAVGVPVGPNLYQYLSNGGANVDTLKVQSDFGANEFTLQFEMAGASNTNQFGIKNLTTGTVEVLFAGADTGLKTASATIKAGDEYAFWFKRDDGGANYTVTSDVTAARFALFRLGHWDGGGMGMDRFVIGIEDGVDNDFQDMVIYGNVVPEPSSILMLSGAVLGTLALVRRRRK